jgi:hypothetical protein
MRAAPPALLAAALLTLAPAEAHGKDPPPQIALRLSYIRGPGAQHCPSKETFRDEVAAKLGYDPFTPDAPERVVITLTSGARGSKVTVAFNEAARAHVWDDKTLAISDYNCAALVAGAALYLTIQFLPFQSPPSTAAPPAPSPPVPPKVEQPPAPAPMPPKVEPTPPRSERLRSPLPPPPRRGAVRLAASSGFGLGVAPADVAAVLSLEGGGEWRLTPDWILSGALGVLYSPRASAPMPVELMSGADVKLGTTLITSVLAPCLHMRILSSWVFGCTGLELGRLSRKVTINGRSWDEGASWAAFQPRLGVEVPVASLPLPRFPQLAARIFGDVMLPLLPAQLHVLEGPSMSNGTVTQVWVTPPVTGAVSVGLVTWLDL